MGFEQLSIEIALKETGARSSEDVCRVVTWLGEQKSKDEDETTQYTNYTNTSKDTNDTTETEESDERKQELQDTLSSLGFSKPEINVGKEMYSRHLENTNPQNFISAMLEVEDELAPPTVSAEKPKDEDETTQYTKHTQTSKDTNGTTEMEESDERVQELKESLRSLGFSKQDINQGMKIHCRHSDDMTTQDFISAMLEVEDELAGGR